MLSTPPGLGPSPLTIFHVVFSRGRSSAERHALDLAEAQAVAGHAVHVVGSGARLRRSVPQGVTWHALPFPPELETTTRAGGSRRRLTIAATRRGR